MVTQFFNKSYDSVFLCILTLFLFTLPSFVEKQLKIDVPNTLEVIIILFIFSAEILGEIREYYLIFPFWDSILHTINGFLCAAIGIAMIDILNRSDRFSFKMSPLFVALVAFCFSMTVGVVWEFFEFEPAFAAVFHSRRQRRARCRCLSV
jgi:xanthine/uracil permease